MADTYEIQFNNHFVEFIEKLCIVFPTDKKKFIKYYKYYKTMIRIDFIAEFLDTLYTYNREIKECDEGLFSEEEQYYPDQKIMLLKSIDFKKLWKTSHLSDVTKNSIWKYLQILSLIGSFALKENGEYKILLENQKKYFLDILNNFKYEKDESEKRLIETPSNSESSGFDFNSLFDKDNIITEIALEVVKELNITGAGSNPMAILSALLGKNPEKLKDIAEKIKSRLDIKLKERGLSEKDLIDQAKNLYEGLMKNFSGLNIPGFDNIEEIISSNDASKKEELISQLTEKLQDNLRSANLGNSADLSSIMKMLSN